MNNRTWILVLLLFGCGEPVPVSHAEVDVGNEGDVGSIDMSACPAGIVLGGVDTHTIVGTGPCELLLNASESTLIEVAGDEGLRLDEQTSNEPGWVAPTALSAGAHTLTIEADGEWSVQVDTYGAPVPVIERERSLVWIDPALVDDPTVVGLGRLMDAAAGSADAGEFFVAWLQRFATTAHSERVGPVQFLQEIEASHGPDPRAWDLDSLEFVVTAVHNRTDLADGVSCGQLRVSVASTHTVFQPFHAIFLFDQAPSRGDVSPGGVVHCGATLRRWAHLSQLDDAEFLLEARLMLDEGLRPARFLMAETVEFIISPWEWRQWLPTQVDGGQSRVFENPPLFQTVDIARLNQPGATRDAFLQFVEENAAALDARQLLIPERFRPQSARVNAGVPWIPLNLGGIDPGVNTQFPELRRNLEIVGCPACHATDAEFIQTRPDRTFSPFYDKELDARAVYLEAAHRGVRPVVPFGPLQPSPVLPL